VKSRNGGRETMRRTDERGGRKEEKKKKETKSNLWRQEMKR